MRKKMIVILIISIIIILIAQIKSLSTTINPDDYNPSQIQTQTSEKFKAKIGTILGGIRNVGVIVSVIILMIIGVKTMFGSIEEKSEYKESMPTFIIGAILLMLCTTIPDIIYNIASKFA